MYKFCGIVIVGLLLGSCSMLGIPVNNPSYTPPSWAIGEWGDNSAQYVAYKITEHEFVTYSSGGSISLVSRYTFENQPITSTLDETGTIWNLVFGTGEFAISLKIQYDGSTITINDYATWEKIR